MKKSELKRRLAQAKADLEEVVLRPESKDSVCIKARVKYASAIQNNVWFTSKHLLDK